MLRTLSNIRLVALSLALLGVLSFAAVPSTVYAGPFEDDDQGAPAPDAPGTDVCAGASQRCNHFIDTYVNPFVYLLSALVGIVAVISIIMGGVQYASSADDPSAVSKAKTRIFNTVIGLVAYIFLFAFFEYLVPGGIF
jgi:hypothetical protein